MENIVFERFRDIIYKKSGITLNADKKTLLASRIQKRLRSLNLADESSYLEIIETDASGDELTELIDAISTNTTYFWREAEHFEALAKIFEAWKKEGKTKIRIWCAASSTGEEPYTLAMEVLEHLNTKCDVKILATDVSTKVLRIAQNGVYSAQAVSKLPAEKRSRFFRQFSDNNKLVVSDEIRKLVLFKQLNLVNFPYPLKGPIDIIFCRNVMIYFDLATRQKLVDEFSRLLAPGGLLFLSLSESLIGIQHAFSKDGTSIYKK